ncbi:MAG: VOC family protein [Rhodospirillales bacterium]
MDQRLSLITLGVADLDRARGFYERLGWTRAMRAAQGVAFFQCGGMALALYPFASLAADTGLPAAARGGAGVTVAQNVQSRAAVDATLSEAAAAGATIVKPGHDTPWGGHVGYFADPDGHVWEVAWNPGFPIAADGSIRLPD